MGGIGCGSVATVNEIAAVLTLMPCATLAENIDVFLRACVIVKAHLDFSTYKIGLGKTGKDDVTGSFIGGESFQMTASVLDYTGEHIAAT